MNDLFGHVEQRTAPPPPQRKPLTAADVRCMMVEIIAALRGADVIPYAEAEFNKHKAMFPIMAQWLEPSDGQALVAEFEAELIRLS